ncbi:MAG: sulfatase-like hydrolase/transferase [Candidatus Binatia bacterium]
MSWLEAHARQPFFVWIHDMSPHLPPTAGNPWLTTPGWKRYDAEVRNSDDLIGRVLRKLAELRLGDDLLIVVTADHGEAFGDEHGLVGHQDVMYDEVLRVPLLIAAPVFEPRRIAAPVELVDLFPTIAALAGLPVPPAVRGESLVLILAGERAERSHPNAFHALLLRERRFDPLAGRCATRNGSCSPRRLDHGHDGLPGWKLDDPKTYFELYRTADDPGEQHDLYEAHLEQVELALRLRRMDAPAVESRGNWPRHRGACAPG